MQPNVRELFINLFGLFMRFEDDRLLAEQARLVMAVEAKGLFFSVIVAIALYVFLFKRTDHLPLNFWFSAVLISSLISVKIMFGFLAKPKFDTKIVVYFLMLSNALMGITWGALAWVAVNEASVFSSIVVIAVLVSLLVGLMNTLSPIYLLYIIACVTIAGLTCTKLLLSDSAEFRDIAWFGLVVSITFLFMARDMSMQTKKNILLQFENFDLIAILEKETAKVRAAQEVAENESHAKTKFLAAASHDIRQPIHALGLFLEVFARSPLSAYQQKVLQNANAAFAASVEMLNTLLDFSRVEAGVVDVQIRSFYLQPLLNKLENEMAPLAANKNLVYRSKDSQAIVISDPSILELILRNLLSNAIRYTESGGVLIACRHRGEYTSLEIWDTGIGIDPIHHENIFKEFYQLGNTERDRRKGLGLGLAIARGYTHMLKHKLRFESKIGQGSVFKIELLNSVEVPISNPVSPEPAQLATLNARVLIIDDDESVRAGMVELFQSWGCQCVAAESINDAVTLASNVQPSIIISDYRLRNLETGVQAITAVRNACAKEIPALLISGDTAKDRLTEASQSGIPLLNKPVSPAVLYSKILDLLS